MVAVPAADTFNLIDMVCNPVDRSAIEKEPVCAVNVVDVVVNSSLGVASVLTNIPREAVTAYLFIQPLTFVSLS